MAQLESSLIEDRQQAEWCADVKVLWTANAIYARRALYGQFVFEFPSAMLTGGTTESSFVMGL